MLSLTTIGCFRGIVGFFTFGNEWRFMELFCFMWTTVCLNVRERWEVRVSSHSFLLVGSKIEVIRVMAASFKETKSKDFKSGERVTWRFFNTMWAFSLFDCYALGGFSWFLLSCDYFYSLMSALYDIRKVCFLSLPSHARVYVALKTHESNVRDSVFTLKQTNKIYILPPSVIIFVWSISLTAVVF